MPTWTKIASDGVSPVVASKVMSCTIAEAIVHIERANHTITRPTIDRLVHGDDLFRVAASEARMPVVEVADIPAELIKSRMDKERDEFGRRTMKAMSEGECSSAAVFAIANGHSHLEQAPRIANYEAR